MAKIYKSAEELIGNTPLLELCGIEKAFNLQAKIYAKLEFFNPAGSIKDRASKTMLDQAEKDGLINKDTVIIEPTSGNTGIGLAFTCVVRGYKLIIVMPDNMSKERITLMKAYGAEVVLTDGNLGMQGAIDKAYDLKKSIKNSFIPDQFNNSNNAKAHYLTTGPEIVFDTDGKVDYFVASVGTGGTLTGTGEYLKENVKGVKVIAVEPDTSPVLSKGVSGKHGIQGIGAGFVPTILNTKIYDEVITCSTEKAYELSRLVGKTEGVLVGISSGANLYASIEIAKREENKGKNIITVFTDGGDRYLSTTLYD